MKLISQNQTSAVTQNKSIRHGLANIADHRDTTCSICLEAWGSGDRVVKVIPCSNCYFHRDCIVAWFESSHAQRGTCPNDRRALFPLSRASPSVITLNDVLEDAMNRMIVWTLEYELSNHRDLWRDQYSVVKTREIIAAWDAATFTTETVERNLENILSMSTSAPEEIRIRVQCEVHQMKENFKLLAHRNAEAVKQVVHERCGAMLCKIEQKTRAGMYFPDFLKGHVSQRIKDVECKGWRFLRFILRDTTKLEIIVKNYCTISSI